MSADPRVVRFIGDGQPWAPDRAEAVAAAALEHWTVHGFGWFSISLHAAAASSPPVGIAMVNRLGPRAAAGLSEDEVELGWWVAPCAWSCGYCREAVAAVAPAAFASLPARRLLARIQPANRRSRAVAAAVGMSLALRTTGRFGERIVVYQRLRTPAGAGSPAAGRANRNARGGASA